MSGLRAFWFALVVDREVVRLRIFGYGFQFARDLPRLFSERYGYRKVHRFGKRWTFQFLTPERLR